MTKTLAERGAELLKITEGIPLLRADWKDTNHYELQHYAPNEEFWWFTLEMESKVVS